MFWKLSSTSRRYLMPATIYKIAVWNTRRKKSERTAFYLLESLDGADELVLVDRVGLGVELLDRPVRLRLDRRQVIFCSIAQRGHVSSIVRKALQSDRWHRRRC